MQALYRAAKGRKERGRLLGQVSETLGRGRRQAKRLMGGKEPAAEGPFRYREPTYPDRLIRILEEVWKAAQCIWSKRLKEALPLWMPAIKRRWVLSEKEVRQLLAMSPATMDRRLAPYKSKVRRQVYGKTKPGRWLRQSIPIQTESWDVPEPGWVEVDTVSHSGPSAAGIFGNSLDDVDKELEKRGHAFARYADDCNVYVRSRRAGERVMEGLKAVYTKLRLKVNESKNAVDRPWRRKFLGYSFWVAKGNLPGWKEYFRLAGGNRLFQDLDGWIRRRLIAIQLKQWKHGRTVYRELRVRGVPGLAAGMASARARHWWRASRSKALQMAFPIQHFNRTGVPQLAA
ncbi:MAG: group II intron maturase-specific domain-containing protein [Elusimicrobia bacterium]|nr:group II intron maturase-specific domain-containing protein [Elusimicrobiota bacterium]